MQVLNALRSPNLLIGTVLLGAALFGPTPTSAAPARSQAPLASLPEQPSNTPWPTSDWPVAGLHDDVDRTLIAKVLRGLFDATGPAGLPDTRALLVIHQGSIVMELYADGFGPHSRFFSWSMAKNVTNAFTGILIRDDRLELDARAPVASWHDPLDPRSAITLRHLLQMTTGLDNADGSGGGLGFESRMMFAPDLRDNMAASAAAVDLIHEPGTHWAYSTATSTILGGIVSRTVGGSRAGLIDFAREELFEPIGIDTMELEFDKSGSFVGGAFVWASARDWARLGYLYLRNGVWDGRRILPEGWVDFSRTPVPASNNGAYGAQFWLAGVAAAGQNPGIRIPDGAFNMTGANGQLVVMVPDKDLVVVRLGEAHVEDWAYFNALPAKIAAAFPAWSSPETDSSLVPGNQAP